MDDICHVIIRELAKSMAALQPHSLLFLLRTCPAAPRDDSYEYM